MIGLCSSFPRFGADRSTPLLKHLCWYFGTPKMFLIVNNSASPFPIVLKFGKLQVQKRYKTATDRFTDFILGTSVSVKASNDWQSVGWPPVAMRRNGRIFWLLSTDLRAWSRHTNHGVTTSQAPGGKLYLPASRDLISPRLGFCCRPTYLCV